MSSGRLRGGILATFLGKGDLQTELRAYMQTAVVPILEWCVIPATFSDRPKFSESRLDNS